MDIVEKARLFAQEAHKNQKRKYSGEPYFVHCEEVAKIVESIGSDDNMIAAAYLHDTVEDTGTSLATIVDEFGMDVAALVEDLTDVSKPIDGNRAARKKMDRLHTAKASPRAKTIKLADLISNSRDILKRDPDFAKVYLAEKKLLLEVLTEGNGFLYQQAMSIAYTGEDTHEKT